ncbi:peptidoglycan endopeptidase [Geobacter grbiciae]|uniref:peptidoglycan endopeptidase n=1 Tax=Geobacter grbiciae TaxID=155042 RepID=UPI001C0303D0|nr:peptidoglycan endopeptidase [Geobacter grbiciae]MBT1073769.1 peptidoglycan endopeptidase [Geobacter grbiciae]
MSRWLGAAAAAFFVLMLTLAAARADDAQHYAVAELPAPVLNTPDFPRVFGGQDGRTVKTDRQGQIRELEFIALPGTAFTVRETLRRGKSVVHRVTTDDYPYPTTGYFVDDRFVRLTDEAPPPRARKLPPRDKVIARLLAARGSRYVWGGNIRAGVPDMIRLFPPAGKLSAETERRWLLQGLDCSGLLYEATDGVTPRNTSALAGYGRGVPIAGLSAEEIRQQLEPLDLIVWKGHVIIVLDRERTIESRLGPVPGKRDGVAVRPLKDVLSEVMGKRVPVDRFAENNGRGEKTFVVRRWYP